MGGFWGADTDAVRQQGSACGRAAESLETLLARCGSTVSAVEWIGEDADGFRARWRSEVETLLRAVIQDLRADGEHLIDHAEEQDDASTPGDGNGITLPPGFPNLPPIGIPHVPGFPPIGLPEVPSLPDVRLPEVPSLPDVRLPEVPSLPDVRPPEIPSLPDVRPQLFSNLMAFVLPRTGGPCLPVWPDVRPHVLPPIDSDPWPVRPPILVDPVPFPDPWPTPRDWPLPQPLPAPLPQPDPWPFPPPIYRPGAIAY